MMTPLDMTLSDRLIAWLREHQGATLDEIATGMRMITPVNRQILVSALARLRDAGSAAEASGWFVRDGGDHPRLVASEVIRGGRELATRRRLALPDGDPGVMSLDDVRTALIAILVGHFGCDALKLHGRSPRELFGLLSTHLFRRSAPPAVVDDEGGDS